MIKLNIKDLVSKSRVITATLREPLTDEVTAGHGFSPSFGRQRQADPYEFEMSCTIDWAMARVL